MRRTGAAAVVAVALALLVAPAPPGDAVVLTMRTIAGFGEAGACTLDPAGGEGNEEAAAVAMFDHPGSMAFAPNGDLYVADTNNHRIRRIAAVSRRVTTVAGRCRNPGGDGDGGPATAARLHHPVDLAFDSFGHLYVADTHNHRIRRVHRVTGVISTVAGTGTPGSADYDDVPAATARLDRPHGIDIDGTRLYVADSGGRRLHVVHLTTGLIDTVRITWGDKVDPNGIDLAEPAETDPDEVILDDGFRMPTAVRALPDGRILVVDSFENRVLRVDPTSGRAEVVVGVGDRELEGTGHATYTQMSFPFGLEVDLRGNIYVGDANRGTIEMVTPAGVLVPVAGFSIPWVKDFNEGYSGDGNPAPLAGLEGPAHLRLGPDGNLYFADRQNHRVRMVDLP